MFATELPTDNLASLFQKQVSERNISKPKYCLVNDLVYKIISEEPDKLIVHSTNSTRPVKVLKSGFGWTYIPASLDDYCSSLFKGLM